MTKIDDPKRSDRGLWVWILEDDPDVRSIMVCFAQEEGFSVIEMGSLSEAYGIFLRFRSFKRPVAILSDFCLSDGITGPFLLECRREFQEIPIYCISGGMSPELALDLQGSGIDVLLKPLSLSTLLEILFRLKNQE